MNIVSSHIALPRTKVLSSEIDQELGVEIGKSFLKTGVESTYRIQDGEEFLNMAVEAYSGALDKGSLSGENLDLLIFSGASKSQVLPCTAALIQGAIGHAGYGCFDIDATCLGFLRALEVAASFLSLGAYSTIAIVVAEGSSTHLDSSDHKTHPLFGDGAVCYILSAAASQSESRHRVKYLGSSFSTYGEHADLCQLKGGLTTLPAWECSDEKDERFKFQMQGRALYAITARLLPKALKGFLDQHKLSISDCDWVVPHQASGSAMGLMSTRLGIPKEKTMNILQDHGNQVAASIPIALSYLLELEVFDSSTVRVLLIGTGAGVGIGLTLLEITS